MKMRWRLWLVVLVFLVLIAAAGVPTQVGQAQASGYVAFINSSGQLVVSSADGGIRWIVTNPGETLVNGYEWSGSRLFFAVYDGSGYSFRVGDVNSQNVTEIGRGAGSTYAGDAFTGSQAFVSIDGMITAQPGGGSVVAGDLPAQLGGNVQPSGAAQGGTLLVRGDGQYQLVSSDGASVLTLGAANDPNSPYIALWSNRAPLVAYADYGFGSGLGVTNASTGATVTLASDGSIPLLPLAWTGTSLIYRGTGGVIRIVDLACLQSGCGDPFSASVDLLAGSATDVQTDGSWVYFRDGETIGAVDLGCVGQGNCLGSAQTLGTQSAPDTLVHVSGGVLIYTGYSGNPYDQASREVRAVDLSCLGGSCSPTTVYSGATAGLIASGSVVVIQDAAGSLSLLNVRNGSTVYLSDGGSLLDARWSE